MSDRILVIEDDELVALYSADRLKEVWLSSFATLNGRSGLQHARRYRPDVVVLDVMMPGMSGFDVCREMRRDPLLKDLPVLFLTAKGEETDRIEGFLAGGDDYLTKPFNLQELNLRLRALLRRSKPTTAQSLATNTWCRLAMFHPTAAHLKYRHRYVLNC